MRRQRYIKPQEDEFYAYDANSYRVNGRYDGNGWFLVDAAERDIPGRCDSDGYLLNYIG